MKRPYLLVALVIVAISGVAALVYASVPHTFNTGDTLQAADLNGNFSALDQRIATLEGASTAIQHWEGFLDRGGSLAGTTLTGTMAHVTFTPPTTGSVVVRTHFSTAVRNKFDTAPVDCDIATQLSTATTAPPLNPPAGSLGVSQLYVAGNLPTQSGGGTYQWFPQTAERAFAVTGGTPITVYLNGTLSSGCAAVYFALSFNADFVPASTTFTVTAN